MKKTISAALGGMPFIFTEEAYSKLKKYLNDIENLLEFEYREETLHDIELRCAELLMQKLSVRQVIGTEDIQEIISILGDPSVFSEEIAEESHDSDQFSLQKKKLFRDPDQKVLGGVASGISHFFGINPILLRVLFVLLILFSGFGILTYLILWIVIPKAQTSIDKLLMKGEKIHFKKIEITIKKELEKSQKMSHMYGRIYRSHWYYKIIDFIHDILNYIFKFIKRFAGSLLIVISGIIILLLLTSIWFSSVAVYSGSFNINGVDITSENVLDYIQIFFGSKVVFICLLGSTFLFIFAVFVLLVYSIRRLFGSSDKRNLKWISLSAFFAIFSGSYLVGYTFYTAAQYVEESTNVILSKTLLYNEGDTIFLVPVLYERGNFLPMSIKDDLVFTDNIELRIQKASDNLISVLSKVKAHGPNKTTAFRNSQSIRYHITVENDKILISNTFSFPKSEGFRRQKAYVDLFVPKNCVIHIPDEFVINFSKKISIPNVLFTSGFYIMTDAGLKKYQ